MPVCWWCPSCRSDYLSHEVVDVFDRKEDAETGLHVKVAGLNATVNASMDGNPSDRRHGIAIRFGCENCGDKLYEEYFALDDITTKLKEVMEKFYASEELRTCKKCGSVMEPPTPVA